jgi:hypothetical protein
MATPAPVRSASRPAPSVVAAVGLLAAFWTSSFTLTDIRRAPPPPGAMPWLLHKLDDNAPGIRAFAIPTNALLFLFGERRGAPTVFVARSATRGGLLFFTPEMALERPQPHNDAAFLQAQRVMRAQATRLRREGVARVLIVPVPTKLSVMLATDPSLREQVGAIPLEAPPRGDARSGAGRLPQPLSFDGRRTAEAYDAFAASLTGIDGVSVVDLHRRFVERQAAGDWLFVPEDSHWTSLGLNLAAAEVVRAWRGTTVDVVKAGTTPDGEGDLQRLLALPLLPWFRVHPFVEDRYDVPLAPPPSDCPPFVALLGSSYSEHRSQPFAQQLSRASGCPVTDLSMGGRGPLASLRRMREQYHDRLRGAVVIWELPFRRVVDPAAFAPREMVTSQRTDDP